MNNLFKTYENKFEKSPSAKASPGMIWKAHKFKKRLKYLLYVKCFFIIESFVEKGLKFLSIWLKMFPFSATIYHFFCKTR